MTFNLLGMLSGVGGALEIISIGMFACQTILMYPVVLDEVNFSDEAVKTSSARDHNRPAHQRHSGLARARCRRPATNPRLPRHFSGHLLMRIGMITKGGVTKNKTQNPFSYEKLTPSRCLQRTDGRSHAGRAPWRTLVGVERPLPTLKCSKWARCSITVSLRRSSRSACCSFSPDRAPWRRLQLLLLRISTGVLLGVSWCVHQPRRHPPRNGSSRRDCVCLGVVCLPQRKSDEA